MVLILFAALSAFALLTPVSAATSSSETRRRPTVRYFIATAYSVEGTGASGNFRTKHRVENTPLLALIARRRSENWELRRGSRAPLIL
jgi:hypothetical protein